MSYTRDEAPFYPRPNRPVADERLARAVERLKGAGKTELPVSRAYAHLFRQM